MNPNHCPLCQTDESTLLWARPNWRVIDARDPAFPAFTRVIWHAHVKEMTDLTRAERADLMAVVFEVESIMRKFLNPDKINVASLGNLAPHLHWHVIGRWQDDPSFPGSIWTPTQQSAGEKARAAARKESIVSRLPGYHEALINHLNRLYS